MTFCSECFNTVSGSSVEYVTPVTELCQRNNRDANNVQYWSGWAVQIDSRCTANASSKRWTYFCSVSPRDAPTEFLTNGIEYQSTRQERNSTWKVVKLLFPTHIKDDSLPLSSCPILKSNNRRLFSLSRGGCEVRNVTYVAKVGQMCWKRHPKYCHVLLKNLSPFMTA